MESEACARQVSATAGKSAAGGEFGVRRFTAAFVFFCRQHGKQKKNKSGGKAPHSKVEGL